MRARRRPRHTGPLALAVAPMLVAWQPTSAQERYLVPRLEGTIVLDGYSDEAAWERIPPLPGVSSFPAFGAEPSERTEFRLAHDDDHLYASARMYDSDPAGIRAVSLRRDESSFVNDWFLVTLDTFRDRENSVLFATTPAGIRTDAAFANDATGSANLAWNSHWDAAAVRDGDGWFAEIRIPLSSLRFQERDGEVVMGVTLARRIARKNEMITWPPVRHDWGTFSIYKASQMAEIVLRDVRPRTPVYLTPYVMGGFARSHVLDAAAGVWVSRALVRREPGFDLKYSPTTNFVVDLTVNPDFAQVEADDEQVNLTRFSLFFPERRPFFQERASTFAFGLGGNGRLFHSRRIGLVDGAPVRILGGARVVGRVGAWDVGAIQMQTERTDSSPVENTGVTSVRRQILNPNSNLGALVTTRFGRDGNRNVAVGTNALLHLGRQDYVTLGWAETFDHGSSTPRADRSHGRIGVERRGLYGLLYGFEAARVGAGFEPALGFVARSGVEHAALRTAWGWRAGDASPLLRQAVWADATVFRALDGPVESARLGPAWRLETKSGHSVTVAATGRYENLADTFRLSPHAAVPAGIHRWVEASASYDPVRTPALRVSGSAGAGGFYDGRRLNLSLSPAWTPSDRLQLGATLQTTHIDFGQRDQRFRSHIARVRALVMLDTRTSALGFVQWNSTADALIANLRVRYNRREGNDLYMVYNQVLNLDRLAYDPVRPLSANRTLLIKYSHTVVLGF